MTYYDMIYYIILLWCSSSKHLTDFRKGENAPNRGGHSTFVCSADCICAVSDMVVSQRNRNKSITIHIIK